MIRPTRLSRAVMVNSPGQFSMVSFARKRGASMPPIAAAGMWVVAYAATAMVALCLTPTASGRCASERDEEFAEHLPALQTRQPALEFGERHFGVDHRRQPRRHLGETFADVTHRSPERADDAVLLLEELHQVERGSGARGCAAGHQ